ncbi:MAG TPA: adenosylcobinamide-phosphate synthase CbiB [Acidimicrobiales bacterium]|nr:adenosylcobinamide-phosphate synthase CbiB [Acidimicrobiales bacterium]
MSRSLSRRAAAIAAGLVADRLAGEPPARLHPVAAFGRVMAWVEARTWRPSRWAGVVPVVAGVGVAAAAAEAVRSVAGATYLAVAGRELCNAAERVALALDRGDLEEARRLLPALVGRDPTGLDEKEVARAAVESVAENTVDAVVAPALWAAAGGARGALAYRAVNTLDAMVGHRSARYERYGWASARLDDLAGWVPGRLTAALVAGLRPAAAAEVWRAVRRDAPAHPSPNAGVAEAAFAAALGLRLGGENRYGERGERVELRPPLGSGRPPEAADITRAVELSRDVAVALGGALIATAAATALGAVRRR